MTPCACGRTGPRVRCVGRTDDMLIVRGVNVFPTAIRDVVGAFAPRVSGHVLVKPRRPGSSRSLRSLSWWSSPARSKRTPSSPRAIRERLRNVLVVATDVELVPFGTLDRSHYKSQLVGG